MPTPSVYRFDGWSLCRTTGELVRADRRTRLSGQPLQVLEALLARPGELVTREALIDRLWPDGVVEFDTALNSAVRRLRRALDDSAERPRYIETIPRRGYRFVVRPEPDPPAARADSGHRVAADVLRRRWRRLSASLLLAGLALTVSSAAVDTGRDPRPQEREAVGAQAHERYLRARYFLGRRGPGDVERAGRYFSEALALDPDQARAWSGLASVYWLETREGRLEPARGAALMEEAIERALALEPRLSEAHVRLGNLRQFAGDRPGAEEQLRLALALDPNDPLALSLAASLAAEEGRLDEAVELQRRSVESDPLSVVSRYNLLSWLVMSGRIPEAGVEMRQLAELNPRLTKLPADQARLLTLEGRFGEALEIAAELPTPTQQLHAQALAWHGLGREEESAAALAALIEAAAEAEPLLIAEAFAFRGELDQAFDWLRRGSDRITRDRWAQYSPFLQPLRADPRWQAWLALRDARRPTARAEDIG